MSEQEHITPAEQYVIDFVRKLRTDKGLTQLDIASIIGVGRAFVSQAESPKVIAKYNIRHINALADYFGISPREFLPAKAFPVDAPEKEIKKKPASKKHRQKETIAQAFSSKEQKDKVLLIAPYIHGECCRLF
ncbi:helix-turn-helix domain-containing protein [Paraflavitalea speifideaquila]|uniref:helix-turn-helix domain-containing protein n=1 Tax=Paraflavitalea speifideaquila TaxID=3076558 RepID=UPI0028E4DDC3|nr:helix-turn-helix domain-containing protein [Paraflavitalea speifideiaquila]